MFGRRMLEDMGKVHLGVPKVIWVTLMVCVVCIGIATVWGGSLYRVPLV